MKRVRIIRWAIRHGIINGNMNSDFTASKNVIKEWNSLLTQKLIDDYFFRISTIDVNWQTISRFKFSHGSWTWHDLLVIAKLVEGKHSNQDLLIIIVITKSVSVNQNLIKFVNSILAWFAFSFINRMKALAFLFINHSEQIAWTWSRGVDINTEHSFILPIGRFLFLCSNCHHARLHVLSGCVNQLPLEFLILSIDNFWKIKLKLANKVMLREIRQLFATVDIIDLNHELLLSLKHKININTFNPLRV